jgi:hypothetical protein
MLLLCCLQLTPVLVYLILALNDNFSTKVLQVSRYRMSLWPPSPPGIVIDCLDHFSNAAEWHPGGALFGLDRPA